MIIRMKHVRAAGLCSRGAKTFCENLGFDWLDFVENGVDVALLEGVDDAMLASVIAIAEKEAQGSEVV